MCLILFAIQPNSDYELVVATNRDEYYARETQMAGFWDDYPNLLAGKDLEAGGTWLGITRNGRFAAVTNFRETPSPETPPRSRGDLTRNFLLDDMHPVHYLESLMDKSHEFKGFNLLVGQGGAYYYFSNQSLEIIQLKSGFYGLSNQLLNCDWPKVRQGRTRLESLVSSDFNQDGLFELLNDKGNAQAFSASFIESSEYGTCASTVLKIKAAGQVCFEERNYLATGKPSETRKYQFRLMR